MTFVGVDQIATIITSVHWYIMQNVSHKCLQNERRKGNLLEMKRLVIQTSITSTFIDQRSSPGEIKELVNRVEA